MRNIIIPFAILLFAFSEGIFAQTKLDTLKIELTEELKQIAVEQSRLQRQENEMKKWQYHFQGTEFGENMYLEKLMLPAQNDREEAARLSAMARTEERLASLRMSQMEQDKKMEEIKIQQEKLKIKEDFIKIQIEVLQKQKAEITKQLNAQQKQQE